LCRLGHDLTVFTAAPLSEDLPSSADELMFSGDVRRFKGQEMRFGMRVANRLMPVLTSLPDRYVLWYWTARRAALQAARSSSAEIIYSRSQPFTSALVGAWVARKLGVPHVANFSDPWVSNPFANRGKLSAAINRRLERSIVESAEVLITTTDWLKSDLSERYGELVEAKTSVLAHSFDPVLFAERRSTNAKKYVVAYIGNLYGARTAVPMAVAANKLAKDGLLPTGFKIRLVGFIDKSEARAIEDVDSFRLVEMPGAMPYRQSLEEMMAADLLVSIDGPGAASHPFLPSKIIEYLGARKLILALTESGSSSHRLSVELGAATAGPDDVDEIASVMLKVFDSDSSNYSNDAIEKFTAESIARDLERILQNVAR
jgi:hypothetical protein